MRTGLKKWIACSLILVLTLPFWVGCGGEEQPVSTIVIGEHTDLTGVSATACAVMHKALEDVVRYYNEENLIPGAELKVLAYDNAYNPARDVPGYEWLRERGAKLIISPLPTTGEVLKPFAEKDKCFIASLSTTSPMVDPPGWVFSLSPRYAEQIPVLLKWVSENDWDYAAEGRPPKVGFLAWNQPSGIDQERAFREYVQAHPDKFDYVGSFLPPVGTNTYGVELNALKDCDYIMPITVTIGYFIRQYSEWGLSGATFISESSAAAFFGFIVDIAGWKAVDGFLGLHTVPWWGEDCEGVKLAEKFLQDYRPRETEQLIHAGSSYEGSVYCFRAAMKLLEKAIGEVGVANVNGQALYDAALDFEVAWEGMPKWWFSPTERVMVHDVVAYRWSAQQENLIKVSDWLSLTG